MQCVWHSSKVAIELHTEADGADMSSRWSNIQCRSDRGHKVKYSIPVCSANAAGVINNEWDIQQTALNNAAHNIRSTLLGRY